MSSTAIVFPGQGSQSIGMLSELYIQSLAFREVFSVAKQLLGYDLWEIICLGPDSRLNQTEVTQPALLACSVGCFRAFQSHIEQAWKPAYFAGHSLGEYSALVCAEAFSLEAGLELVATRGRLMQAAVPEGKGAMMVILGLSIDKIEQACREAAFATHLPVSPANLNTPEQTVIAGAALAVEAAGDLAKAMGAKRALLLPMSVPSHCMLLKEASEQLAVALDKLNFKSPRIPVIHNATASVESQPETIKKLLVSQLYSPVRWVQSVHYLRERGVSQFYECGPGKVLAGLIKRIDGSLQDVRCDTVCA